MPHPNSEVGGSRRAGSEMSKYGGYLEQVEKEDLGTHGDNKSVNLLPLTQLIFICSM